MNDPLLAHECDAPPHHILILIDLVRLLAREAARIDFSSKPPAKTED